MIEVNKNSTRTDVAWKRLYSRLNQDNLLPATGEETIHRRLFLKWGRVAAAVFIGAVCLASVLWIAPGNRHTGLNLVIQENREASTLVTTLEDGSIVYLGQQSTLKYPEHFAADKREVLGTAFNVRSNEKGLFCLSVRRGRVRVSMKQGGHSVLVDAGKTVTLQEERLQLSDTRESGESGRYTRNIRFKDECLEDILRVVNDENSALRLQVGSPALNRRRLTIEFSDSSPEMVAELICYALGLKCSREDGKLILSE